MNEDQIVQLRRMADRIRRTAVEMAYRSGSHGAHLGGSLSCVEIYAVLYGAVMNFRPEDPLWEERDRFVAGKEHARLAEYPAMAEAGLIPQELLFSYLDDDGLLTGHPYNPEIGLQYSCCSLGMALPVAVGMALDAKRRGRKHRVFTIMGDGEMDEGLIWEGFLSAAQFRLDNLVAVIDRNGLSSDGNTETIMGLESIENKLKAFNWNCTRVNGHDIRQLADAFAFRPENGRPYAIIAETVKGKGLSFAENNPGWHQGIMTDALYQQALQELQAVNTCED